jgi:hypothetical protein
METVSSANTEENDLAMHPLDELDRDGRSLDQLANGVSGAHGA